MNAITVTAPTATAPLSREDAYVDSKDRPTT
jgi:hypothetical protein